MECGDLDFKVPQNLSDSLGIRMGEPFVKTQGSWLPPSDSGGFPWGIRLGIFIFTSFLGDTDAQ